MVSDVIATPRAGVAPLERWYVLIVMCLVYAINIAARYVVTTVFEPIRLELALSDAGAAFLTGVPLALFYVVCGIPIAWLADRSNRRNIVAVSLVLWSGFTVLCGLSVSYLQFLLSRIGVGVGEAGGTPSSTSIVSDCFPAERRPMALSVFALGAPIGAWLGADLAGAVAQAHGWRAAFFALGVPGVVLGLLVFLTIREPRRGQLDAMAAERRASFSESLAFLWRQRAAFHVIMGSGVCSLWGWGLVWWTPTFLLRNLRAERRAGGRPHGPHPPGRRLAGNGQRRVVHVAPQYAGCAARALDAGVGYRLRHRPLAHRLLDPLAVGCQADVLGVHPRDLFLHRTVHGAGAESGTSAHAFDLHRVVGAGR